MTNVRQFLVYFRKSWAIAYFAICLPAALLYPRETSGSRGKLSYIQGFSLETGEPWRNWAERSQQDRHRSFFDEKWKEYARLGRHVCHGRNFPRAGDENSLGSRESARKRSKE